MSRKVLEWDQFKYLESTQTRDGISLKEVKIILAQAYSALTLGIPVLWKNNAINF